MLVLSAGSDGRRARRAALTALAAGAAADSRGGEVQSRGALVAIVARRGPADARRYEQRSWELCQHANDRNTQKRDHERIAKAAAEAEDARVIKAIGQVQCQDVVVWAENDVEDVLTDGEKASILIEAAVGPTVRGSDESAGRRRLQQDRMAAALTAFADQHLKSFVLQRFEGAAGEAAASNTLVRRGGGLRRLVMCSGAFDTARQRARPLARDGDQQQQQQRRQQTGHVGLSFLMQQAELVECRVGGGGDTDWVCREAFAPKGLCTTSKTADFMIEG